MKNPLWTRNFSLLIAATTFGCMGGIVGNFALSFLVFDETGSTFASALVIAIQLIPNFLIPLLVAPWMDRFPRKPFLVFGDFINGIFYALMGIYLLFSTFHTLVILDILCFLLHWEVWMNWHITVFFQRSYQVEWNKKDMPFLPCYIPYCV